MNNDNYLRFGDLKTGDHFIAAPSNGGYINTNPALVYVKVENDLGILNAFDIMYGQDADVPDWYPVIRVKRVDGTNRWENKWEMVEK